MRFESLKAKGLGPFREEITIDLKSVVGPLVAVIGENGAGKSTILELLAGAMYRSCPTRGPLSSLATARDASLEVTLVNGASHRIHHVMDAVNGKGESVVTDADGRPCVSSGKMREFDAWAAKHLPAKEVFYASVFSPQKSQGFLDMSASERKSVLLRCLGIERYEVLAEKAREHLRSSKTDLSVIDARLADERSRASDPDKASGELASLKTAHDRQTKAVADARAVLRSLQTEHLDFEARARAAEELRHRITDLDRRITDAESTRVQLETRIINNKKVLTQQKEIDAAQAMATTLDAEVEELATRVAEATGAEAQARADRTAARDTSNGFQTQVEQAQQRRTRIEARLADKASVELAVSSLPNLRENVQSAEDAVASLEANIVGTQDLILNSATQRITDLREGLSSIVINTTDAATIATETLTDDDAVVASAEKAPDLLKEQRATLAEKKAAVVTVHRSLAQAEKSAARAQDIAAAEIELTKSAADIRDLEQQRAVAREAFDAADEMAMTTAASLKSVADEQTAKKLARAKLEPLLKLAPRLAEAEARLSELRPQLDDIDGDLAKLRGERAALPASADALTAPDIEAAHLRVDQAESVVRGTEGAIAVKETHLTEAHAAIGRIAGIVAERDKVLAEVSDWTRLSEDLGRDGLQALEIDAAGPRLTEIANQLLHDAFGPRFTIRFDLSRRSADGKKDIEGLDVTVIDTERGREANAETLSGGEGVIISEAIALALTTIACARSGVERPTLVRDESGAALDERRAPQYVRMLRRAAELIGADKVLLVSHSPAVWDLCDARIEVANGQVTVAA